jgi:N-dimethylarginine dimethylaminohydrolase
MKYDNRFLHEFGKPPKPDKLRKISFIDELEAAWGRDWGVGTQSELGKIKVCLVSKPTENEASPEIAKDPIHYLLPEGLPDLEKMKKQHESMVQALRDEGVEIVYFEVPEIAMGAYSRMKNCVATREVLMVHGGAIIPRIGLAEWRRGYEALISKRLSQIGCPILHTCVNMLDGGAHIWLDQKHLVTSVAPGTSLEGINEIKPVLEWSGVEEIHISYCTGWVDVLEITTQFSTLKARRSI